MPFSLYLQQSAISHAQLKQYASTAQLFDMVKWTKEAYNHFGVPYFDTCCQAEPYNIDLYISDDAGNMMSLGADGKLTVSIVTIAANLVSAQAGNNIIVSSFDNKLWAPQVSGMVYATGTTNYIAKFQGATSLIDSRISDNGTTLSISALTSATGSNVMYYNNSTGEVTYGALPATGISGTPYYIPMFDATGAAITNSQVFTGSNRVTLIIDGGAYISGYQPMIIKTGDSYTGTDPYQYRGFDVYNMLNNAGTGEGIHFRGYYLATYAGMYSQSVSYANSNLRFYVTNNGAKTEGIQIDTTGYVGIGAITPTANLHVSGTTKLQGIANTTTSNVLYYNSSTGSVTYGAAPSGASSSNPLTYYIADTGITYSSSSSPVPISSTTNGVAGSFSFTPALGKSYTLKATLITYDSGIIDDVNAPGIKIATDSTSQFTSHDIEVIGQAMNSGYEFLHYLDSTAFTPTYSTSAVVSGSTGYGNNVAKTTIELTLYNCTVVGGPVFVNLGVKNSGLGKLIGVIQGSMVLTQLN